MELEPLMGRYFRLKQELLIAYRARPWQSSHIDRLADDLAAAEREIGELQAQREAVPSRMERELQQRRA
jgi:hypothetical protein